MADLGSLLGGLGGSAIGQAVVRLDLDTKQYQAEMAAAKGSTEASATAMSGAASKFSGAWLAGAGVAAGAVIAFAADALSSASDLNESLNKTNVVFGDSADAVVRWSETSAESMGISQQAALEAASTFGNLFTTMEIGEPAATAMSENLVRLASDLASFNNVDPSQVLENLRSGLVGEIEPLRKYGIQINAAAVEQEALTSGLWDGKGALDANARTMATYQLILDQTSTAQGDFARTSDDVANAQRTLNAQWEDTKAHFGEALVPVAQESLSVFSEVLDGVNTRLLHVSTSSDQWAEAARRAGYSVEFMAETTVRLRDDTIAYSGTAAEAIEWVNRHIAANDAWARRGEFWQRQIEANTEATRQGRIELIRFADMTGEKLVEWRKDAKKALESYILDLDNLSHQTEVTQHDFIEGHRAMLARARETARALREIAGEEWINQNYIRFLQEQGPEFLVTFADLNERQQHRMQQLWKQSADELDTGVIRNFNRMINQLDEIDGGSTKHDVFIEYHYVGFDPTKPGMGDSTGRGGPQ